MEAKRYKRGKPSCFKNFILFLMVKLHTVLQTSAQVQVCESKVIMIYGFLLWTGWFFSPLFAMTGKAWYRSNGLMRGTKNLSFLQKNFWKSSKGFRKRLVKHLMVCSVNFLLVEYHHNMTMQRKQKNITKKLSMLKKLIF